MSKLNFKAIYDEDIYDEEVRAAAFALKAAQLRRAVFQYLYAAGYVRIDHYKIKNDLYEELLADLPEAYKKDLAFIINYVLNS